MKADTERTEQWVACGACHHRWILCYLPLPVSRAAAAFKRATCPMCGGVKGISIASAPIVLSPAKAATQPEGLTRWLASGERGISSNTIVQVLTGLRIEDWPHHPLDPSDFRRCELLLDAVPEFDARLAEMASQSAEWKALVGEWGAIRASLRAEIPEWRTPPPKSMAPKTYALMKRILGER